MNRMGDARTRDDSTVRVGGDRFHGCRPDVDPDRDFLHLGTTSRASSANRPSAGPLRQVPLVLSVKDLSPLLPAPAVAHIARRPSTRTEEATVTIRPKALITAPFRGVGLQRMRELADVVLDPWIDHEPMRIYGPEELAARLRAEEADILVCEADFCSGPVFDLSLRAIASTRGDPTNVDLARATEAGVPVLHTPGRNADAVAELALGLLLAATRHIIPADRDVRAGEVFKGGTVPYQRYRGWQIAGRTVGIVGYGAVGHAVRWRLEALGLRVLVCDPYAAESTHKLDDLLAEADIVTLHAAVTPETQGLIGAAQFARMKDGVVFLNTAREALHDRDALVAALRSGKVAAAGLDHFAGEQLPPEHPLLAMDNVVLTPHIGGATYDTEINHSLMVAEDLARLLEGERPLHIANPEVLP
jgi:D-3-phosphoglycerate dehydrogenase